ncbi:hypothetical protein [Streptomyces parvus]|uniref:hypothetical protein n=1 Tax=Streptomyces parvus TaxID=66428 RepID=UPI0034172F0D
MAPPGTTLGTTRHHARLPTAHPYLMVAAHTTAAGTLIDDSTWAATGIARRGDDVEPALGTPSRT